MQGKATQASNIATKLQGHEVIGLSRRKSEIAGIASPVSDLRKPRQAYSSPLYVKIQGTDELEVKRDLLSQKIADLPLQHDANLKLRETDFERDVTLQPDDNEMVSTICSEKTGNVPQDSCRASNAAGVSGPSDEPREAAKGAETSGNATMVVATKDGNPFMDDYVLSSSFSGAASSRKRSRVDSFLVADAFKSMNPKTLEAVLPHDSWVERDATSAASESESGTSECINDPFPDDINEGSYNLSGIFAKTRKKGEEVKATLSLISTVMDQFMDYQSSEDSLVRLLTANASKTMQKLDMARSQNHANSSRWRLKVEKLEDDLSSSLQCINQLRAELEESQGTINTLTSDIESLKCTVREAHEKSDKIAIERDNAYSKYAEREKEINTLKMSFGDKDSNISKLKGTVSRLKEETRVHIEDMALLQTDLKTSEDSHVKKDQDLLTLGRDYFQLEQESADYKLQLEECEKSNALYSQKLKDLSGEFEKLKAETNGKDVTIAEYATKVNGFDSLLNSLKSTIHRLETESRDSAQGYRALESKLVQQVDHLEDEVVAANKKSEDGIREIAQQLYHQYSKKHERKVSQLRANHEVKLKEKDSQIKESESKIHSLTRQLQVELREKEYLLGVVEGSRHSEEHQDG